MAIKVSILVSCALLSTAAYAADIYQWVDKSGRTHVSDIVPPQYKDVATRVDTRGSEISERQRLEAIERAAREKREADNAAAKARADAKNTEKTRENRNAVNNPPSNNDAECEQMVRAYRESQECFAPFMRQRGGTRKEAYQVCTQVPEPSAKCGLPP